MSPTVEILGSVSSKEIWPYISSLPFEVDTYKSTVGRETCAICNKVVWKPNGSTCQRALHDSRIIRFLRRVQPKCAIALALRYSTRGRINQHRDSTGYGSSVVSVSSQPYFLQLGSEVHEIPANTVVRFPSKAPHAAWHETDEQRIALCGWELVPDRLTFLD